MFEHKITVVYQIKIKHYIYIYNIYIYIYYSSLILIRNYLKFYIKKTHELHNYELIDGCNNHFNLSYITFNVCIVTYNKWHI